MSEIEKKEEEVNTSNIFDEFEIDEETKKDFDNLESSIKKDIFYYLDKFWNVLRFFNYTMFIVISLWLWYIFLQNTNAEFLKDQKYLAPVCSILNWNIPYSETCSALSVSTKKVDDQIKGLQKDYLTSIISILQKTYEIDNVKNSKESIFIIDKYRNKNDPYYILNEFDKIINEFTSVDKKKIQCDGITITWNVFEAKCGAFSTLWYDNIPWIDWDKINTIQWTSISLASSFINYLSKIPDIKLLDRQKTFESKPYFWEWNYTYKTDFKIKFEYGRADLSL